MQNLFEDIIYYSQAIVSIYLIINTIGLYQKSQEFDEMKDLIDVETEYMIEKNDYIKDVMSLNENFRKSYKCRNEKAEPFLELIKNTGTDNYQLLLENIDLSINHFFPHLRSYEISDFDRKILADAKLYPRTRKFIKEVFYQKSLSKVGTFYSHCCFCMNKFVPHAKTVNDEYHVYPNYFIEYHSFFKLKVNGEDVDYLQYRWKPEHDGTYYFELEYQYLEDNKIRYVSDELIVEVN